MRELNTWPGWECVRQLGSGAFGKVYEIQRVEGNKTYKAALKVITVPQNQADVMNAYSEGMTEENVTLYFKSFVDDITNEFALMSDLKGYTNIVSYEDHMVVPHKDSFGWDILIRMELLTPLQKWCLDHELSEEDIIRLGCDICRALELCHKKKIIHRDIKPENIFVNNNGDFKLGDFGIARVAEKTTSVLSQKGTYTYMAPEVYKGQSYNQTVDIYSLGIVLYRFLNLNRTPFLPLGMLQFSDRQLAQERRIAGETIPAPVNGSDELKMFILKALQYEPEKRYQTASAFRKALESCIKEDSLQEDKTAAVNGFMNNQEEMNVSDDVADSNEEKTAFESLDFHKDETVIETRIPDRDEENSEKIENNKGKGNNGLFPFLANYWPAVLVAIICIGLFLSNSTFMINRKSVQTEVLEALDEMTSLYLEAIGELTEEQIETLLESDDQFTLDAMKCWTKYREQIGDFVRIISSEGYYEDDVVRHIANARFEKEEVVVTILYDSETGEPTSMKMKIH